jgi:hypothetical protein
MLEVHRVPLLSLLVCVVVQVGCAPSRPAVRVQTGNGHVRTTTPPPRPPLALPKEEVRQAVRAPAREVVPAADPVAFAREQFGIPVMEGTYLLDGRTKELKPADKATEATEVPPPELVEQARKYLEYCAARHMPGDCFGALQGRRTLDAHGRYTVAMGIAIAGTFEATKDCRSKGRRPTGRARSHRALAQAGRQGRGHRAVGGVHRAGTKVSRLPSARRAHRGQDTAVAAW